MLCEIHGMQWSNEFVEERHSLESDTYEKQDLSDRG